MVEVNTEILEEYEELTMDFILGDFKALMGKGIIFSFDEGENFRVTCAYRYFKVLIDDMKVLTTNHRVYDIITAGEDHAER